MARSLGSDRFCSTPSRRRATSASSRRPRTTHAPSRWNSSAAATRVSLAARRRKTLGHLLDGAVQRADADRAVAVLLGRPARARRTRAQSAAHAVQQRQRPAQQLALIGVELAVQRLRQPVLALRAGGVQRAQPGGSARRTCAARRSGRAGALNQPAPRGRAPLRHRLRPHALGGGQLADAAGPRGRGARARRHCRRGGRCSARRRRMSRPSTSRSSPGELGGLGRAGRHERQSTGRSTGKLHRQPV